MTTETRPDLKLIVGPVIPDEEAERRITCLQELHLLSESSDLGYHRGQEPLYQQERRPVPHLEREEYAALRVAAAGRARTDPIARDLVALFEAADRLYNPKPDVDGAMVLLHAALTLSNEMHLPYGDVVAFGLRRGVGQG